MKRIIDIRALFYLKSIVLFLLIFLTFATADAGDKAKRVLLISSYHPDFPTFFNQINGIQSVFKQKGIDLDIEFMDSKRFYTKENLDNFYQSLSYKLSKMEPYDLIMTADDNALAFVLEHKKKLFSNTPTVFFGVNSISLALKQNTNPKVTGIVESVSIKETLELILKNHPGVNKIIALTDVTPTGQSNLRHFYQNKFQSVLLSDISLKKKSFKELPKLLKKVDKKSVVLWLSAFRDKNGKSLSFEDSLKIIKKNLSRPLYQLWRFGIGDGMLGGKIVSHYQQGKKAAEYAVQIFNGKAVSTIPVETKSPNVYVFDYKELKRFHIRISGLPVGSIIINQPKSFYQEHKAMVWGVLVVFILLSFFIVFLAINVIKRKNAEKALLKSNEHLEQKVKERTIELEMEIDERKQIEESLQESESRFHSLSDASFEAIFIIEQDYIIEVNHTAVNMFGYNCREFSSMLALNLLPKEKQSEVQKKIKSGNEKAYRSEGLKKDGTVFPIEIQTKLFQHKNREVQVVAVRDLTEREKREKEIFELQKLLPICAKCKKIRDKEGYWEEVESYIESHSNTQFSHSLCKKCSDELYGNEKWYKKRNL